FRIRLYRRRALGEKQRSKPDSKICRVFSPEYTHSLGQLLGVGCRLRPRRLAARLAREVSTGRTPWLRRGGDGSQALPGALRRLRALLSGQLRGDSRVLGRHLLLKRPGTF